jgi:hypothetical protein
MQQQKRAKALSVVSLAISLTLVSSDMPSQRASAQGWELAAGAASAVGGYLTDRQRKKEHAEIKKRLAEIKTLLAGLDKKMTQIQSALIALGDYLKDEFNAIYVADVSAKLQSLDQDLDIFTEKPRANRDQIRTRLTSLREAVIKLHARPPDAYDWVGSAMPYEDSLIRLLPKESVNRAEVFGTHARYFSAVNDAMLEDIKALDAGISQIETYHSDLAKQPQILQFIKVDYRGTRNCWDMKMNVYRVIEGNLELGYKLTGREVTQNIKCIHRNEPRSPGDGPGRSFLLSVDGVGTTLPEETPPYIPKRVVVGELNTSREDWLARRDRHKTITSIIKDCTEYLRIARALAAG